MEIAWRLTDASPHGDGQQRMEADIKTSATVLCQSEVTRLTKTYQTGVISLVIHRAYGNQTSRADEVPLPG